MKNIVIIGGSRGIGSALCSKLSQDHKVLVLSRNIVRLEALKTTISNNNLQIGQIDITAVNLKSQLTEIISQHFDRVDVLINNAGFLVNKPVMELTISDLQTTFNTNVFGLVQACQAIVPYMENKGGHIVNIGSMGGFQGSSKFPGLSIYSASKSAVAGFSECLAEELKDKNIQVNCLALGAVQTEMLAEAFPGYEAPLSAEEMADFIGDFSLSSNKWINGKVIPVSNFYAIMKVRSVNIGKKQLIDWRKKVATGIFKFPIDKPIQLEKTDVVGDTVVDRKYHGGIDKACYIYSADHYKFWQERYPDLEFKDGIFGENITVEGLDESQIQIGDIFYIGECRVQVKQPRQPCFKLGVRFGTQKIIKDFINNPFPGIYVSVIDEGIVKSGDKMQLSERLHDSIGLIEVWNLLYGTDPDQDLLEFAIDFQHLADDCRSSLRKRLKTG